MLKVNHEKGLMTLNGNKAGSVEAKKENSTFAFDYEERHQKDKYSFEEAMTVVRTLNDKISKHLKSSHDNISKDIDEHINMLHRKA